MTPLDFIPRPPRLRLWERVHHISDFSPEGVITAFMQRGNNYSYEVNWGIEKCLWHMEEELVIVPVSTPIGFVPHQNEADAPSATCSHSDAAGADSGA